MKVGINARTFSVNQPGGAVQTAMKQTRGLLNCEDTEIVLFGHESVSDLFPETPVVSVGYAVSSQAYGLFWERIVLPRLADRHNIDVLYCPNANAPATETSYPVVMCIHDVNAMNGLSSRVHQIYRKLAVPRAAELADQVVTVSEFSKGEISDQLNIHSSKVDVVYNGIDEFYFTDETEELPNLPEDYILFVGSMNPRKNIERVIKAYTRFKQQTNHTHSLVIIGPNNKTIFKNIDVSATRDIVTPGFVSQRELKYAYENAELFLFPSLYEGFGLPPLEALACGTPVVTSETTSLGEIVQQGGIQVDPTDVRSIMLGIRRIIEDDLLARELAEEGQEYAKNFAWKNAIKSLHSTLLSATG